MPASYAAHIKSSTFVAVPNASFPTGAMLPAKGAGLGAAIALSPNNHLLNVLLWFGEHHTSVWAMVSRRIVSRDAPRSGMRCLGHVPDKDASCPLGLNAGAGDGTKVAGSI